ncbi:MAG TPA: PDGLE domain-containing protein [Dermatophilaceae bacterium]|nr:PDGLE domain-containing protein [Dermatophilaceae bacterium]
MTRRARVWWLAGLLACLLIAGIVSRWASAEPDGLERVAEDHGLAGQAVARTGLLEYGPATGVLGVLAVLALTSGLALLARRRAPVAEPSADAPVDASRGSDQAG